MKTQNSKKKLTTSGKSPMEAYHRAMLPFYVCSFAVLIGALAIAFGLCVYSGKVKCKDAEVECAAAARMPKYPMPILHQEWRNFLLETNRVRRICMADQYYRTLLAYRWTVPCNPANQFVGTEYEQWVTEDIPPRIMNVPGIPNVRDLGGWHTEDGMRIKQGLIYRSSQWNVPSVYNMPGFNLLSMYSYQSLHDNMGIKTEIDLRKESEVVGLSVTNSPLGTNTVWIHRPFGAYADIFETTNKVSFTNIVSDILAETNFPMAIHCTLGRDNTGTLFYVLEGLLGVSDEDKQRDWEASAFFFADPGFIHVKCIDPFTDKLRRKYSGKTNNERCVAYAKDCGLTDEDIDALKTLLLEELP